LLGGLAPPPAGGSRTALDRQPDPLAALRLPRREAPPLGYFAETPRAANYMDVASKM